MKEKLGSIIVIALVVIFVSASILASYYGSTSHSDAKLCNTQTFILRAMDDLTVTANLLVATDQNLDNPIRARFVKRYDLRHKQILQRLKDSGCPIQDSQKRQNPKAP